MEKIIKLFVEYIFKEIKKNIKWFMMFAVFCLLMIIAIYYVFVEMYWGIHAITTPIIKAIFGG